MLYSEITEKIINSFYKVYYENQVVGDYFADIIVNDLVILEIKVSEGLRDENKLKKTLKKIYDYRSKALHGGIPFPPPMCMPPTICKGIPSEVPLGLATMTQGGVWVKKDIPILLHTFEYIVRGALLSWWTSLYTEI